MNLSKNNPGIAHLAVLIIISLAAIGFVGYVAWNAYRVNEESKAKSTIDSNSKNTQEAKVQIQLAPGGTKEEVAVKERVQEFYSIWLNSIWLDGNGEGEPLDIKGATVFEVLSSYITPRAYQQVLDNNFNLFMCTNAEYNDINIENPEINGAQATITVSPETREPIKLLLIQDKGFWSIDKVICT